MPNQAQFAISSGRVINSGGRLYKNGAAYSMDLKLEVATAYQESARQIGGRPNLSQIARTFKVDTQDKRIEESNKEQRLRE